MSDNLKRSAAEAALDYIADGMVIGLGTGSTADYFISALGEKVRLGLKIIGVPSSRRSERAAQAAGIPLTSLDDHPELDVTVDGADEIDPQLRLIKGAGGALLREKIVAGASRRMIVIADESKLVAHLGAFPLPVEIVPFGARVTLGRVTQVCGRHADASAQVTFRLGADGYGNFVTDNGNLILDCKCGEIRDPEGLARELSGIAGVAGHGLFIGLASLALIGGANGVRRLER